MKMSVAGQGDLFDTGELAAQKPADDLVRPLRVIITVKAAPQPSTEYGETVCVAGWSIDPELRGWVRLYPINFRYLDQEGQFKKYDVVSVDATPARRDGRRESWRPRMDTLQVHRHLSAWAPRQRWLKPLREESMCALRRAVDVDPSARSLGLVRAKEVSDLIVRQRRAWTADEQRKIDKYVNQFDLFDETDRTPLQAPPVTAAYRWRCYDPACRGHEQSILDWEFVAFQRRFVRLGERELVDVVREKFLNEVCAPARDVSFYVGNQAKRYQAFSILGVFWPPRDA
jgi:hypothetical protein